MHLELLSICPVDFSFQTLMSSLGITTVNIGNLAIKTNSRVIVRGIFCVSIRC